MSEQHCQDPSTCPTNIERERDMEAMKEDYDRTQSALEETNASLSGVKTEVAVTNKSIENLCDEIRRDREFNERERERRMREEAILHKRITDHKTETVNSIAAAKIASVQEDADIKVNQASKLSTGDLVKLFLLFSTVVGIATALSRL